MGAQPFQPDVPAPGGDDAAPVPGATREFVRVPVHAAQRPQVVCISSESLLAGATEVQIEHRGALYRLKQTSLGKLILTK